MTVEYRIETDNQGTPVIESDYVSRVERMSAGQGRRQGSPPELSRRVVATRGAAGPC